VIQARAYERYERRGREDGHALDDWISAESEMRCLVPVGILESPEQLEVHVRLLGCLSNEIEVGLEPSCLCIRVQKETEGIEPTGEGSTKQLLNGIFVAINLPAHVDPAKVTSAFKDGDLCLSLSRAFA
jgi:HSP20 family molecular chaperone IbpA